MQPNFEYIPTSMIPQPILPETYASSKLRVLPVNSDAMEPTFMRGDCVVILPVTEFDQDCIYAIGYGDGAISIVRATYLFGRKQVRLRKDNPLYHRHGDHDVDLDWFNDRVIGLVVADIRVREANILRRISA